MNFKALMCQLGLVLASTTAIASLGTGVVAQELTVVSFGGAYQDAQSKALFQPAAKALGIKLKEETYTGIADLRLKVKAGAVSWDVVPPEKVYEVLAAPGGIERAIKKIKELKPHVAVWWSSGAQHAQLMKDGEVDMITGWNGRFDVIAKDGAKVAYTFNQALLDYDCYAIAKGAPNKDLAMKFLAEISKPQYQAEFTKFITYGPTDKKAYELGAIEPGYAKRLPSHPDNAAKQLTINLDWYIKFEEKASAAYQNMLTE